jgi:hypothetical protein
MAALCVSIFVDRNEAKTHACDLKVLAVIDTDFPTDFPTTSASAYKVTNFCYNTHLDPLLLFAAKLAVTRFAHVFGICNTQVPKHDFSTTAAHITIII